MENQPITDSFAQQAAQVAEVAQQAGKDWGWTEMLWVTLISICLVFIVLVVLVFVMKGFGYIFTRPTKQAAHAAPSAALATPTGQLHEEEIAAIATALQLFKAELHDRESEVLTIQSIKRAYSPWSSKIHGLTQMPDKK